MLLCKRKRQGRFISFIVRTDSMGSSSSLQGWLNPLCAGDAMLRCGLWGMKAWETDPALGPCEPAQVQRALGRESGVQVATPTLPFICCSALDLSFYSSNNLLLLPCHRNMELQRPWSLRDAWGFSDEEGHSRLMKRLKQWLKGLGTQ